jgi:hypothetical protein
MIVKPILQIKERIFATPQDAYLYAFNIDKCPRNDTRNTCLSSPMYAYYYAMNIDKCPRYDTLNACKGHVIYENVYYFDILDEKPIECYIAGL